jgi:hypothetical protein
LGIPGNLEAYQEEGITMWDAAKSVKDAVTGLEKRAEESITDAERALTGDTSQDDVKASDQKSREAGKESADTTSAGAKAEAERHTIHFKTPEWKDVVDKAEEVRDAAPKAFKFTKMLFLKIAGGVVAAGLVTISIFSGSQSGGGIREHISQTDQQIGLAQMEMQVEMNQDEFNNLIRGLDVANLPSVPGQAQPEMPVQAQAPAQVAMPMVVAAVAQTPVTATVNIPTATAQTIKTDVGTVYRTVPQSRNPIERYVSEPRSSGGFHGTIHVESPVGTASFGW